MKFKNSISLVLFVMSTYSLCMENVACYSPGNTRILWDFHRVIVNYDTREIMRQCWKRKRDLIHCVRPFVLYQLIKGLYNRGTGGEWGEIVTHYPTFAESIIFIGNCVKPIEGTVQIMQKLKELGYDQDLCSDINTYFLQALEEKDSLQQTIFKFLNNKKSVDSHKPGAIFKFNPHYFIHYKRDYNKDSKQLIFIDDLKPNIESAEKNNIRGILFKNSDQLSEELKKLGILPQN